VKRVKKDKLRHVLRRAESKETKARIRLPGFLVEEEIGLGDVIKKLTYSLGIQPCGGCRHRAEVLNRWVAFSRRAH